MTFKKGHIPWSKGKHINVGKNHPMYGKHHSEKTKKKISNAKKGQLPWNKGKHVFVGKDNPFYGNHSFAGKNHPMYGKHHTKEAKEKISESLKGNIPWNKGLTKDDPRVAKMSSIEVRKKRSKTLTEYYKTHENPFKGGHHTKEIKRKIGDASLECWQDPKHRKKMSVIAQKHWEDPEYVKRVYANIKPNKLERKFDDILQKYFPNEWKYNGDFSCGVTIGGLIPDFININGRKTVIELFGKHWHTGEKVKNRWKGTEFGKKAIYSQLGYDCIVIWDYELEDISNVIGKITENFGKTV